MGRERDRALCFRCEREMKKGKGIAVSSPKSGEDTEKDSPLPTLRFSSRNASSKYDFVKVFLFLSFGFLGNQSEIDRFFDFVYSFSSLTWYGLIFKPFFFGSLLLKVKVWLGENADHYYVLSRFLLSRMLTVTKVSNSLPSQFFFFFGISLCV